MTKLYIYPYSSGSESAKLLAERLGAKRIKLTNSEYVHKDNHLVINWGNSNCPYPGLNPGPILKETVDKLKLFRLLTKKGLREYLPNYWTHPDDIPDNAFPIFCRTTTKGCDGAGIVIANNREELVNAPLYTAALKDTTEYRVTILKGYGITDIQTKLPRAGQDPHPLIKTYANGYGFQRKPVDKYDESVLTAFAAMILTATGLDFCGIDVLYKNGECYILEVNTAMGLEGDALERFARGIEALVEKMAPKEPEAPKPSETPPEPQIEAFTDAIEAALILAVKEKRWADVIKLSLEQITKYF